MSWRVRNSDRLLIFSLLIPPWAALLVGCYWYFIDCNPPLQLIYQHPKFLTSYAATRDEAREREADSVPSGSRVWIYREMCNLDGAVVGRTEPYWVAGAFIWQAPQRSFPMQHNCFNRSYELSAPSSNPTREFEYHSGVRFENNPLVNSYIEFPMLKLKVLAPHES